MGLEASPKLTERRKNKKHRLRPVVVTHLGGRPLSLRPDWFI